MAELNDQLDEDQREYEAALKDRDGLINKMKLECEQLVAELQALLDTKQNLDSEIVLYRKMLEGEENRKGLRQLVETVTAAAAGKPGGGEAAAPGSGCEFHLNLNCG